MIKLPITFIIAEALFFLPKYKNKKSQKIMFWQCGVCASNVKYSSFKRRTPTGESPRNAGVTTRSLVSRKVVYREVCTEVSETTSVCTDEQKLNRRHRWTDKVAQHTKVQSVQKFNDVDSAGVSTLGYLTYRGRSSCPRAGQAKKSAEVIVVRGNEPMKRLEDSRSNEGLNMVWFQMMQGSFSERERSPAINGTKENLL